MPPEPKSKPAEQTMVMVEIHPDSPVDVIEGVLVKGEPKEFTAAEADALLAARFEGRQMCRVVPPPVPVVSTDAGGQ